MLNKFKTVHTHAFEISLTNIKVLHQKFSKNPRITINKYGLSNRRGEVEYKDYGRCSKVNTILEDANFHDHNIKPKLSKAFIETGDRYCVENGIELIDLLKIDTEGAEHLVLSGFCKLLEEGRIRVIQFEYGYTHADAKFLMKDFYKMLVKYGYVIGVLKPGGVIFTEFKYQLNDFQSGPNYVAVHKSCSCIIEKLRGKPIKGFLV